VIAAIPAARAGETITPDSRAAAVEAGCAQTFLAFPYPDDKPW